MAKKTNAPRSVTRAGLMKSLTSKFKQLSHGRSIDQVFRDFCEVTAIALSNAVDKSQFDVREARYLSIYKAYSSEKEKYLFPEMMAEIVEIMEFGLADVFQEIWLALEIRGNSRLGQVFTPFHLSHMMARMTLEPPPEVIARQGFFTLHEPACGPGGMIIAAALTLEEQELNFRTCMHVTAVDIDPLCVHMAYIACCLYAIPAIIYRGDTLRMEMHETWYSTMHVLNGWSGTLRLSRTVYDMMALLRNADAVDINEAWSKTSTPERIRLMTEAGIEDLSLILDERMPEGVVLPVAAE